MRQETLEDGSIMIIGTKEEIEKMMKERIEPAKKEPVTFGEWNDNHDWCEHDSAETDAHNAWQDSEKNRDLLYADLLELADEWVACQCLSGSTNHTYFASQMAELITKIKQAI